MTKKLKSIAIILAVCSLFLVSPVFAGTCDVVCWESCSSCEPPEMNMNAIISKSILDVFGYLTNVNRLIATLRN